MYKREIEDNGVVLDPLKAVHTVTVRLTLQSLLRTTYEPPCEKTGLRGF